MEEKRLVPKKQSLITDPMYFYIEYDQCQRESGDL